MKLDGWLGRGPAGLHFAKGDVIPGLECSPVQVEAHRRVLTAAGYYVGEMGVVCTRRVS